MPRWFFSYGFVDRHAEHLWNAFAGDIEAHGDSGGGQKAETKQARKTDLALQRMIAAALRFQREEKLNFFQRARFAQQLQNRLISHGYAAELVDDVVAEISGARDLTRPH